MKGLLRRLVDIQPHEVKAVAASFVFFFFVLSSYFILRPIRDSVAVAAGVNGIPWLFAGTLVAMLIANPLFSSLVVRFPARRFVPFTYTFFVLNLLAFYFVMRSATATADARLGVVFYIWMSFYNLFLTSVFWSFMADIFRSEQAKRLFGFIGVGGTLGSISGSATTAALAQRIGPVNLLLVSAALLQIAALVVVFFPARPQTAGLPDVAPPGRDGPDALAEAGRSTQHAARDAAPAAVTPPHSARRTPQPSSSDHVIGGSLWAGMTRVVQSPYLLGIAGFMILYTLGSTYLYFEQAEIIGKYYVTRAARTEILAKIELTVQTLTVITQIFLTGRIIRWLGLALALAWLPALSMLGFATIGALPVLATLIAFTVARRASNFALTNPAMEVLFTVVSREDKYKAKSFIETFVYRAGDQLSAWAYAGLAALGLGFSLTAWTAVPLSAAWLVLAIWLGRRQAQLAGEQARAATTITEPRPVPAI